MQVRRKASQDGVGTSISDAGREYGGKGSQQQFKTRRRKKSLPSSCAECPKENRTRVGRSNSMPAALVASPAAAGTKIAQPMPAARAQEEQLRLQKYQLAFSDFNCASGNMDEDTRYEYQLAYPEFSPNTALRLEEEFIQEQVQLLEAQFLKEVALLPEQGTEFGVIPMNAQGGCPHSANKHQQSPPPCFGQHGELSAHEGPPDTPSFGHTASSQCHQSCHAEPRYLEKTSSQPGTGVGQKWTRYEPPRMSEACAENLERKSLDMHESKLIQPMGSPVVQQHASKIPQSIVPGDKISSLDPHSKCRHASQTKMLESDRIIGGRESKLQEKHSDKHVSLNSEGSSIKENKAQQIAMPSSQSASKQRFVDTCLYEAAVKIQSSRRAQLARRSLVALRGQQQRLLKRSRERQLAERRLQEIQSRTQERAATKIQSVRRAQLARRLARAERRNSCVDKHDVRRFGMKQLCVVGSKGDIGRSQTQTDDNLTRSKLSPMCMSTDMKSRRHLGRLALRASMLESDQDARRSRRESRLKEMFFNTVQSSVQAQLETTKPELKLPIEDTWIQNTHDASDTNSEIPRRENIDPQNARNGAPCVVRGRKDKDRIDEDSSDNDINASRPTRPTLDQDRNQGCGLTIKMQTKRREVEVANDIAQKGSQSAYDGTVTDFEMPRKDQIEPPNKGYAAPYAVSRRKDRVHHFEDSVESYMVASHRSCLDPPNLAPSDEYLDQGRDLTIKIQEKRGEVEMTNGLAQKVVQSKHNGAVNKFEMPQEDTIDPQRIKCVVPRAVRGRKDKVDLFEGSVGSDIDAAHRSGRTPPTLDQGRDQGCDVTNKKEQAKRREVEMPNDVVQKIPQKTHDGAVTKGKMPSTEKIDPPSISYAAPCAVQGRKDKPHVSDDSGESGINASSTPRPTRPIRAKSERGRDLFMDVQESQSSAVGSSNMLSEPLTIKLKIARSKCQGTLSKTASHRQLCEAAKKIQQAWCRYRKSQRQRVAEEKRKTRLRRWAAQWLERKSRLEPNQQTAVGQKKYELGVLQARSREAALKIQTARRRQLAQRQAAQGRLAWLEAQAQKRASNAGRLRDREAALKRLQEIVEKTQNKAAIKLQSAWRGHLGRKEALQRKARFHELIKQKRKSAQREGRKDVRFRLLEAIDPSRHAAALKIQRVRRGQVARRQFQQEVAKRYSTPDLKDNMMQHLSTKEQFARRLRSMKDKERRNAAIKIQSVWRGRAGRTRAKHERIRANREACARVRQDIQKRLREIEHKKKVQAAIKIQNIVRGRIARIRARLVRDHVAREAKARSDEVEYKQQEFEKQKKIAALRVEKQQILIKLIAMEETRKQNGTVEIQRIWRGHTVRRKIETKIAKHKVDSEVNDQERQHCFDEANRIPHRDRVSPKGPKAKAAPRDTCTRNKNNAAVRIQRVFRGFSVRKACKHRKQALRKSSCEDVRKRSTSVQRKLEEIEERRREFKRRFESVPGHDARCRSNSPRFNTSNHNISDQGRRPSAIGSVKMGVAQTPEAVCGKLSMQKKRTPSASASLAIESTTDVRASVSTSGVRNCSSTGTPTKSVAGLPKSIFKDASGEQDCGTTNEISMCVGTSESIFEEQRNTCTTQAVTENSVQLHQISEDEAGFANMCKASTSTGTTIGSSVHASIPCGKQKQRSPSTAMTAAMELVHVTIADANHAEKICATKMSAMCNVASENTCIENRQHSSPETTMRLARLNQASFDEEDDTRRSYASIVTSTTVGPPKSAQENEGTFIDGQKHSSIWSAASAAEPWVSPNSQENATRTHCAISIDNTKACGLTAGANESLRVGSASRKISLATDVTEKEGTPPKQHIGPTVENQRTNPLTTCVAEHKIEKSLSMVPDTCSSSPRQPADVQSTLQSCASCVSGEGDQFNILWPVASHLNIGGVEALRAPLASHLPPSLKNKLGTTGSMTNDPLTRGALGCIDWRNCNKSDLDPLVCADNHHPEDIAITDTGGDVMQPSEHSELQQRRKQDARRRARENMRHNHAGSITPRTAPTTPRSETGKKQQEEGNQCASLENSCRTAVETKNVPEAQRDPIALKCTFTDWPDQQDNVSGEHNRLIGILSDTRKEILLQRELILRKKEKATMLKAVLDLGSGGAGRCHSCDVGLAKCLRPLLQSLAGIARAVLGIADETVIPSADRRGCSSSPDQQAAVVLEICDIISGVAHLDPQLTELGYLLQGFIVDMQSGS